MNRFKFRAECLEDVVNLLYRIKTKDTEIHIKFFQVPDVEAVLATDLSLEEVIDQARAVTDGHVIVETVQPEEEYTGDRDWNRSVL
jgi:hypothetical protein